MNTDTIRYRILPSDPAGHLFTVHCTVQKPQPDGQRFFMPAWIPGSYMVRDFARNVVRTWARADRGVVAVSRVDKNSWGCEPCAGPLTFGYEVYAYDLSVRAAYLDRYRGYFNGTSVFVRACGHGGLSCQVELLPPESATVGPWRVATTLPRIDAPEFGFGLYHADDYDTLIDHPVELGEFQVLDFEAAGVPHQMVLTGRQQADSERLRRDLGKICEQHIGFFQDSPPMDRYQFLTLVVGEGYGGLEHRDCCSLICRRNDLPRTWEPGMSDGYRGFLGLCSHEYFHAWNVKRIKPAVFAPYRLEAESYTTLLWAFEGITSYYDDLALRRCGLIDRVSYLQLVAQTATRVLRGSGRLKQSLADSSFDAWTKFYRQDENAPNAIVSYYAKGALVALALDLELRLRSDGGCNLDEVMRALWRQYGRTGIGVPEDGVELTVAEVSGLDLGEFFATSVHGVAELPLAERLADFGVCLQRRPASGPEDKGGTAANGTLPRSVLGVRSRQAPHGAEILNVFDDGAAHGAGLAAGDVVVAIDGLRVSGEDLHQRVGSLAPGQSVTLHAFRRDELLTLELTATKPPADTINLALISNPGAAVLARRDAWLGSD
jgi:predicted metalloprotease with PDZ domain